jgi:hypothetical protein
MNRKCFLLAVSIAAVLVGAANAATPHKAKPKDERVAFLEHAHEAVAATLLDPPSARFANEALVRNDEGKLQLVCGFVQGKNSFGGYAVCSGTWHRASVRRPQQSDRGRRQYDL